MEDRSWMYRRYVTGVRGITIEFEEGVKAFISFAMSNAISNEIRCPCAKCKNMRFESPDTVETHLYKKGFVSGYYEWICHGEGFKPSAHTSSTTMPLKESNSSDMIPQMVLEKVSPDFNVDATKEPPSREAKKLKVTDVPIWNGCTKFSQLSLVSRLLKMKSENDMSEKCFNQIVQLLKEVVPPDNNIPNNFNEMKKIACDDDHDPTPVEEKPSSGTHDDRNPPPPSSSTAP